MVRTRVVYKSNVKGLGADLDRKLKRIVERSAREGAAVGRALSDNVSMRAGEATEPRLGYIVCPVTVPASQFWSIMQDKGTLGQRKVPLKYPGKRKSSWQGKRRAAKPTSVTAGGYATTDRVSIKRPKGGGATVTFHRSTQALAVGGMAPKYFYIRGQRHAERMLAKHLIRGL